MRTRRRASHDSLLERWNGRFTAVRRRPKKPFLISTSSVGEPCSGIGAVSYTCMKARLPS
jgi:hypothetical protein